MTARSVASTVHSSSSPCKVTASVSTSRPARPFFSGAAQLLLAVLLALPCATASAAAPVRIHPFLFITTDDVERARQGVRVNPVFAQVARDLTERATTNMLEDLPPLQRDWWLIAKAKPWSDTYPEIFHHTWMVPLKWAELARNCARASLLTSSLPLAAKGRDVLLRLSDYTFEFEHFDVGMNYTVWTLAALDAYDILYGGFTPEQRARLDAFFERYLAALRKSDDYWIAHEPGGRLNNHYAWHKLGLSMIGLFYGRPELVERALSGPKGVEFMLAQGFRDDGLWLEGSISYQLAETSPLVLLAHIMANAGYPKDLFRYQSPNGYSIKKAYDALIPLLFPDRTLPAIGDCYARRVYVPDIPDWEILFRRFRDPTYAWLIADAKTRTPQALFSGVINLPQAVAPAQSGWLWPEMGYVALRSNEGEAHWSGQGWSLFATFSGQPVHEHADKLSLILFADGHLWLPDLEAKPSAEHAFSSATQAELNRQTLCHNTLLVDGQSQRYPGQRLDLLEFTNTPSLKRATIGDLKGRLYTGVRQSRTLILGNGYLLDFFQVASGAPHEFAWLTHIDGLRVGGSVLVTNPVALPAGPPWSYLRDARGTAEGESSAGAGKEARIWECFSDSTRLFRLDVLADGPMKRINCGFPRDDSADAKTVPMRVLQRQGTNAWFLAAYRLVPAAGTAAELKVTPSASGNMEVSLQESGRVHRHLVKRLQ
jgi:hypothetical protein